MASRNKILSWLGTGASMLVLASGALAATDKTFNPMGNWSVNRIDPRNGGSPYCTLARSFDGGMVVTFARNTEGEGTVAIDFQQPLFEPNQTYRISLQAGYGLKREFLTRPATPNALVLRTGQDPQFFNALAGSSDMGVIFDNGRYAFSMPDFNAGESQLSNCIGGTPATGAPRTPAANTDSAALAQLRSEIDALKQENASIAASLRDTNASRARDEMVRGSAESDALLARLSNLENEKSALVEKLQTERTRQQQEAQDEDALRQALADQKNLKQMLESERKQRRELESALKDKTAEAEKRGELKARIQQLESSNTELKALRDSLEIERSKRMAVEKQLQEQKAASAATLEDQERLRTRVNELESKNAALQETASQYETTKVQLKSSQSRALEEKTRREAAEQALKEVQMSASEREAKLDSLQMQMELERQKLEKSILTKETQLTKQHSEEVARLNMEIEKLNAVGAEKAQIEKKYSTEQARRTAVEQALKEAQMAIAEKEAKLAALQQQMEVERLKLQSSMAARQSVMSEKHAAEVARLNMEIEKLNAVGAEIAQIEQKYSNEQARRTAVEQALKEAQAAIGDRETKLAILQSQMEQERAKLQQSLITKETQLTRQHSEEVARLNMEIEKLHAVGAEKAQIEQKYSNEQARRTAVEQALKEAQAAIGDRETKLAILQSQMEQERAKLQQSLITKETQLTRQHSEEVARLNMEIEKLHAVGAEKAQIEQKYSNEQARRTAVEQALKEAQAAIGDRETKLAILQSQMEQERAKLQQSLITKETQLTRQHSEEVARLNMEIEKLAAVGIEKRQIEEKYSSEQARRAAVEKALQDAQLAITEKEARLASLQSQMEQERAKLQQSLITKETQLTRQHSEEVARLNMEIEKLEAVGVEKQLIEEKYSSEQARRAAVETALQEAQMAITEKEARLNELQNQLAADQKKLRGIGLQREELSQTVTAEQARRAAAERALNAARAEQEARLAEINAQAEEARKKAQRTALQREELSQTVTAEQARRAAAERELNATRAERSKLVAQLEDERKAAAKARELEQDNARLQEMASRLGELETKNTKLVEELQNAKTRTIEAEKAVASSIPAVEAKERFDRIKQRAEADKNELKTLLEVERARREKLERIAAKGGDADAKLREIETQMGEIAKRNGELEKALRDEQAKTTAAISEREQQLKKQLETMKADNEMLAEKLASSSSDMDEKNELKVLLEVEKARRLKLEQLAAQNGDETDRLRELEMQMADLGKRNEELEKALKDQKTSSSGDKKLLKQLEVLRADNARLAEELHAVTEMAKTSPAAGSEKPQIIVADDSKMAEILAETKSSLASAVAERNEYRDLLQRERLEKKPQAAKSESGSEGGLNTQISALEEERATLIRELEYERSRNEAIATGGKVPPASGKSEKLISERLAKLEEERNALKKQLQIAQNDIIEARRLAQASKQPQKPSENPKMDADVSALLAENQKLLAELEASAKSGGKNADTRALESEIASLRAQNQILSKEVTNRLSAAPARAEMDNAAAQAEYKVRSEMGGKLQSLEARYMAVEAENMRLAKALAEMGRRAMPVQPAKVVVPANLDENRIAAMESENIRLAQELAKARTSATQQPMPQIVEKVVAVPVPQANPQKDARMAAMESENIRLAQELAKARMQPIVDTGEPMASSPSQPLVASAAAASASIQTATPAQPLSPQSVEAQLVQFQQFQQFQAQQAAMQKQALSATMVEPAAAPVQKVAYNTNAVVRSSANNNPASTVAPAQSPTLSAEDVGPNGRDIENYLRRAGVAMVNGLEKVRKVSNNQFAAFRWDTGVVFGTAEQRVLDKAEFENAIAAYLQKTRDRCSGTFDQSYDPAQETAKRNFVVADVACIMPDGMGAGAAILFFYKDGLFNVVAHEGEIRQFDQAMSTRDILAKFMENTL